MPAITTVLKRFRRSLIVISSLILVYTLAGFFLVPWLAEKQITSIAQQRLGVETSVEKIEFNPYSFELKVQQFSAQMDKQPLVSWQHLYINLQPTQLFKRNLLLDEISITTPKLYIHRYSETKTTLTVLADNWQQTAVSEKESEEEIKSENDSEQLLNFVISALNYEKGELHYRDDVPEQAFQTVLSPINIHLQNFSTRADQQANNDIVIQLENNAELRLNGSLKLAPLHLVGQATLSNLSLQTPFRYVQSQLPFLLDGGRLNLSLAYQVDIAGTDVNVNVDDINLDLAEFSLNHAEQEKALADVGTIALNNGRFSYPENALTIDKVAIDSLNVQVTQNKQGELNWLTMLADMPSSEAKPESDNAEKQGNAFGLSIAEIALTKAKVNIDDDVPSPSVSLGLDVESTLKNLALDSEKSMPLTATVTLVSGGDVLLDGDIALKPSFAMDSKATIKQLSLLPIQPYINQFAHIGLVSGNIDSTLNLKTNQQQALSLKGDLQLNTVELENQVLNEKLLSVDKLSLNTIDFSLASRALKVSEVVVDQLYSRVKMMKQGKSNVGELLIPQPQVAETESTSEPFDIDIGRLSFNNASSHFTDDNLPIEFNANIHKLNGDINGISSRSSQPVDLGLEGQVDEFGLVEINGKLNPFDVTDTTKINLAFTNLNLPNVSPYTIKFAGREIADGRGDITLSYDIVKNELSASNTVILRDIKLGERVESPEAMDLPLDLAIALLKNSDGVIDLSIPVSGNMADPQFDFGPVIRDAIGNVLRNIVTAPFRFLAGLFGSEEPIEDVRFRAARSDLAPPEQEKLLKLVNALQQRPQLVLSVPAPFDMTADAQGLKQSAVNKRVEAAVQELSPEIQLVERTQSVLESLYQQAQLSPELSSIKQDIIDGSKTEENPQGEFDTLAYNALLKDRLIEAETVNEQDWNNLALARQASVLAFVKQNSDLTDAQLAMGDLLEQKLDDGWLRMSFGLQAVK